MGEIQNRNYWNSYKSNVKYDKENYSLKRQMKEKRIQTKIQW